MDLNKINKSDLILMCKELGLDVSGLCKKTYLIQAIEVLEADEDELWECWELVEGNKQKEKEENERKKQAEDCELEMKRMELEIRRLVSSLTEGQQVPHATVNSAPFKIKDLIQSYKIGKDIGLFLINFERTCEKNGLF